MKDKTKCLHKWTPLAIDKENGYVFYECLKCGEVCWSEIEYLEWIHNLNNNG